MLLQGYYKITTIHPFTVFINFHKRELNPVLLTANDIDLFQNAKFLEIVSSLRILVYILFAKIEPCPLPISLHYK